MKSDILHQTFVYLKDLPADSPHWEVDVPTFLSSVTKLSDEKAAERAAAASLRELARVLAGFSDQYSSQLEYFELDVSGWAAPANPDASVLSEVHNLIERLSGFIDEHASIPERGVSLSETRHFDEKRRKIEERILSVKSELDQALVADGEPEQPPPIPTSDTSNPPCDVKAEATEVSNDATLSDLKLSDGRFEFDPATANHTVFLQNSVDGLVITPVPNVETATVDVSLVSPEHHGTGCVQVEGGSYRLENILAGQTSVSVTVTAEDGATKQGYFLTVERAPSDEASLRNLELVPGGLEFDPSIEEYNIELADGSDNIALTFKAVHGSATVVASLERPDGGVTDVIPSEDGVCEIPSLGDGQSTLLLTVTAEDGVTRRTYTVTLTCQSSSMSDTFAWMWGLVAEDDLAGAYWISKSLAAQDLVDSQLPIHLKAVQGSRWLSPESSDYVEDLFETVSSTDTPLGDDEYVMLRLAASIQPSLVAPETNLLAWLDSPSRLPSVERMVSPIRDFANLGYALGPEHIQGDEWERSLQNLIAEASSNARAWLEDSSKRYQNFVRANSVWKTLCTDNGLVHNLLSPVMADQRSELVAVKSRVDELRQETYRAEIIAELNENLRSSPKGRIVGAAREWLHHRIDEAIEQAERWCDLVERANEASDQSQNQWLSDRVAELRAKH